jgi:hypothetical protein
MPRGAEPKTVENGLTAESYEIKFFSRTVSSEVDRQGKSRNGES